MREIYVACLPACWYAKLNCFFATNNIVSWQPTSVLYWPLVQCRIPFSWFIDWLFNWIIQSRAVGPSLRPFSAMRPIAQQAGPWGHKPLKVMLRSSFFEYSWSNFNYAEWRSSLHKKSKTLILVAPQVLITCSPHCSASALEVNCMI